MKPIRILYFIAYPQRLAGANRSLFELVSHLPPGFEPVVVSVGDGAVVDAYRSAGIPIQVVAPGKALSTFGRVQLAWSFTERAHVLMSEFVPYTRRLLDLFAELEPSIIHANDPRGALLIGPAAKWARLPFVSHLRGGKPFGGMYWWPFEILPDRIITVCQNIVGDLMPWAQRKAVTVYNGTTDISDRGGPMPWLRELRSRGIQVVSCFASVTAFKGIHHFLSAAAMLNARGYRDQVVFLSVGDVPTHDEAYFDWLSERRSALDVDNFTFAGVQQDPFAFYRETDITVLPSVGSEVLEMGSGRTTLRLRGTEGLPRTHLEAMSFAIPTVGTNLAGVTEQIVDGVTGFVIPPSDPRALADRLERLLKDPALRKRMGLAGRQRIFEKFTTDQYVAGVVRVYEELLHDRGNL